MTPAFEFAQPSRNFCEKNGLPYPLHAKVYDPELFRFFRLRDELAELARVPNIAFMTGTQTADTLDHFNPSVIRDFPRATIMVPVTCAPSQVENFVRTFNAATIQAHRADNPIRASFFFGSTPFYSLASTQTRKAMETILDAAQPKGGSRAKLVHASNQRHANHNAKKETTGHEIGLLVTLDGLKPLADIEAEITDNTRLLRDITGTDVGIVHFMRQGLAATMMPGLHQALAPTLSRNNLRSTWNNTYKAPYGQTLSYSKGLRIVTGRDNPFEYVLHTPDYAFSDMPLWPLARMLNLPEIRALKTKGTQVSLGQVIKPPLGARGTLEAIAARP